MDNNLIKEICLEGSRAYYEHLANKRNGGVDEIEITRIERVNNDTFKLALERKLFELDAICFLFDGKFKAQYSNEEIVIKVYDNEKRILIVKVKEEIIPIISDLNSSNWKVIIDLKFLIQRVIDWYKINGNSIVLNPEIRVEDKFDTSVFINGLIPSEEQKKAIDTIFKEKLCYIWGAPGTGKTRFVLSYSLLHYIEKKKKVLVLAPTNVALEQVMSGVMDVLAKAKVSHKKIIRLGYPSKEFADKYGDICEIQGLEKELKRLEEQIKIISAVLGIKSDKQIEIERKINIVKEADDITNQRLELQKNEQYIKGALHKKEEELLKIKALQNTLNKEKNDLVKRKNSIIGKLFIPLNRRIDYDKEIKSIIDKETAAEKKYNFLLGKTLSLKKEIGQVVNKLEKLKTKYNEKINFLFDQGCIENKYQSKLKDILKMLDEQLKSEIENNQINQALSVEYEKYNKVQLEESLTKLLAEKKKLESYSLESRIETALLIGATIDTYLYRFKEKPLDVSHVFIDEAGYASVVKALTVFTLKAPVTLLGDHMQLQPVCELSKKDILQNEEKNKAFVWDQSSIFVGDFWRCKNLEELLEIYKKEASPDNKSISISSLTFSYRFGPNLAKTLSKYVYTIDGFRSKLKDNTEIYVFDVPNPPEARIPGSRLNEAEAQCIKKYVEENFDIDDSFAVLAPYRDQVNRLKQILPEYKDENKILTVHKSQGREWDTVIYSVCDIDNGCRPWFTDSVNSLSNGIKNINTAVSRAKKRLVIFCNKHAWTKNNDQLITGLINSCTSETKIDSKEIRIDLSQLSYYNKQKAYTQPMKVNNKLHQKDIEKTNGKDHWESKTLYWSKKKLDGYKYSEKNDAWWKKK